MSNQNLYPVNTYNPVLYFSIYFHSLNKKGNIILLKFHLIHFYQIIRVQ